MRTAKELKEFKRQMTSKPTLYERRFAEVLNKSGVNYKQQMICGFYILDFVLPEKMIVIEIDGKTHEKTKNYDNRRDEFLSSIGYKVIRKKNEQVESFDIKPILEAVSFRNWVFRGSLSKANVKRGAKISGQKM